MNKRIYIIAGEASGDVIGAEILKTLPEDIDVYGIGGTLMEQQGLTSLFDYTDLSLMGLSDIIRAYGLLKRRITDTVNHICETQPHMVISIDSQGFSKKIGREIRKRDVDTHHMHIVAPTVWAWRAKRAKTLHHYFDSLLCLFPFEPEYFKTLPAHFVGHPSVEMCANTTSMDLDSYNAIGVLVGSRRSEIERCAIIYAHVLQKLYETHGTVAYVPAVERYSDTLDSLFAQYTFPYHMVSQADKNAVLKSVQVALTTSGTMTLELAVLQTPMVVGYKIEGWFFHIVKHMYYKKHVSLPNIILGDTPIVPEHLQSDMTVDNLYTSLCHVLDNPTVQRDALRDVAHTLAPPDGRFGNSVYTYIKRYMPASCDI